MDSHRNRSEPMNSAEADGAQICVAVHPRLLNPTCDAFADPGILDS